MVTVPQQHTFQSIAVVLTKTFQVSVVRTTVIFSFPLLRSIMLEVSYSLVSRSEILCLSCTVKWEGGSQHSANSLPFINEYKLIKPLLFFCSFCHFLKEGLLSICWITRHRAPFQVLFCYLAVLNHGHELLLGCNAGQKWQQEFIVKSCWPTAPCSISGHEVVASCLSVERDVSIFTLQVWVCMRLIFKIILLNLFYHAIAWPQLPRTHPFFPLS